MLIPIPDPRLHVHTDVPLSVRDHFDVDFPVLIAEVERLRAAPTPPGTPGEAPAELITEACRVVTALSEAGYGSWTGGPDHPGRAVVCIPAEDAARLTYEALREDTHTEDTCPIGAPAVEVLELAIKAAEEAFAATRCPKCSVTGSCRCGDVASARLPACVTAAAGVLTAGHEAELAELRAQVVTMRDQWIDGWPDCDARTGIGSNTCALPAGHGGRHDCQWILGDPWPKGYVAPNLATAEQRGAENAARAIAETVRQGRQLGPHGWAEIERRAVAAGWDAQLVRDLRAEETFEYLTIAVAFEVASDAAALYAENAARGLASTPPDIAELQQTVAPTPADEPDDPATLVQPCPNDRDIETPGEPGEPPVFAVGDVVHLPSLRKVVGHGTLKITRVSGGEPVPADPGSEPRLFDDTSEADNLPDYMAISDARQGVYSTRCWGDGDCKGWLWLDIGSREYALKKARQHLTEAHAAPPASGGTDPTSHLTSHPNPGGAE